MGVKKKRKSRIQETPVEYKRNCIPRGKQKTPAFAPSTDSMGSPQASSGLRRGKGDSTETPEWWENGKHCCPISVVFFVCDGCPGPTPARSPTGSAHEVRCHSIHHSNWQSRKPGLTPSSTPTERRPLRTAFFPLSDSRSFSSRA